MLIMRNAIETISRRYITRLEFLRHKGAHQSAEMSWTSTEMDRAMVSHQRDDSLLTRERFTPPGSRGTAISKKLCQIGTAIVGKGFPNYLFTFLRYSS